MTANDDGQLARFRTVFDAHYGKVVAYARRRCATGEDAEDAVAETFTIAWRKFDAMSRDEPLPWLYAVGRKVIANQRRGEQRRFRLFARLRQERPSQGRAFDGEPVREALSRLSADDQELLRLVAWEGLGHGQVAQAMGISTNAVTIRLHRARQRLREELERAGLEQGQRAAARRPTAG
jgi:RNA polymerase sigma-70 factor (ECF subfamily)